MPILIHEVHTKHHTRNIAALKVAGTFLLDSDRTTPDLGSYVKFIVNEDASRHSFMSCQKNQRWDAAMKHDSSFPRSSHPPGLVVLPAPVCELSDRRKNKILRSPYAIRTVP
ncbi:hypothetical protein Hypma_010605 [Hypsizygus marmoreus]|uniref:Uncharacterized protein n=1 Tax=Hypsizygus marmoreus TaxID=39966 RepID=A0A369JJ85_HYPMA|nr:hypothetical protein Hypma_010605 [Hypsizygus marmoreus]